MSEDFDRALRGERGYRGIEPSVAAGLFRLGLITEEQARLAADEYAEEWKDAWVSVKWWDKTAELAWQNSASRIARFLNAGVPPYTWRSQWIKEHRGW